jgi:hypothetical protein
VARRENGNPCDADLAKRSQDYFHQMVEQCIGLKVSRLVVCDTNGGSSPEEVAQTIDGLTRSHPGPGSDFMATPIAALVSPIAAPQFSPAQFRFRARCWEPVSAAATLT